MQVKFGKNSIATVKMTIEELNTIRYTLATGAEKLQSTAMYLKTMESIESKPTAKTARKAKAASKALETAVKESLRKRIEELENKLTDDVLLKLWEVAIIPKKARGITL